MNSEQIFSHFQKIIPQHLFSRLIGKLANCSQPMIKDLFISWFIKKYGVNMEEALVSDPKAYKHFNEFFTRALKPEVRPLVQNSHALVSPVDGTISELGTIESHQIFQAKNHRYTLNALLNCETQEAENFVDGAFATIYLAPKDYHRIHMPITGTLKTMRYVPGKLFSVNPGTTNTLPDLFARNERVICTFETACGPMAIVLVGAMIVASIKTSWAGIITPKTPRITQQWDYSTKIQPTTLEQGQEMGQFQLGSTVILLFGKERVNWLDTLQANSSIKMGALFGNQIR